jgi:two-component system chemotaxis response regulator CheB
MSPDIIPEFVHSLSQGVSLTVQLASQNEVIINNHIYVAPGDMDTRLILDPLGNSRILLFPPTTTLTPSIDVLMASAATVYGTHSLGIILTGMGVDGLEGMRAIKAVGGMTIVQDEATSAVYGMAQAVNNEHLADVVLPLQAIAEAIASWSTTA